MLIILDRSEQAGPVWGPGIVQQRYGEMTIVEAMAAATRRLIENMGVPAEMFRGSPTFRSVTTGRASSSIPNMSAGSVRRINWDDEELTNVAEAGY